MKKILLLGGSAQQVVAIKAARNLGYYTILCDFLPDNPGQYVADKFYLVSTTDKNAVLEVAQKEQIDGVLAYASDPAAPTAAYIAEKLGLPGNPYRSVEILCNKDQFRKFLLENGFSAPKATGYSFAEDALKDKTSYEYPIIIKPVDSSGSKGATVLYSENGLVDALEFAFSFSRCHRIIVERFIEKKHPYLIGGDIFIEDGKVVVIGKTRGKKAAEKLMHDKLTEDGLSLTRDFMFGHINCSESLETFINKSLTYISDVNGNVGVSSIGCSVGTHVGPGTYGIAYVEAAESGMNRESIVKTA